MFVLVILGEIFVGSRYYRAEMQILVEQNRVDPAVSAEQNALTFNKPVTIDQVTSETELLLGSDMMRKVVDKCGLANNAWSPGDLFRSSDPKELAAVKQESAARTLAKKLKVTADTESDVITVKYARIGEPEAPACVLQTLAALYMDKHLRLSHPEGSSDVFSTETAEYKKKLDDAESRLITFSKTENVAAPDVIRTAMAQQITDLQNSLEQARQQVAASSHRIAYLNAQLKVTPSRSPTMETANAANLLGQNLQTTLLAAKARRADLLTKYDPSFPLVKEVNQEIEQTEEQIRDAKSINYLNKTTDRDPVYELIREDLAKTKADQTTSMANVQALQASIKATQAQMVRMDGLAVKSAALQRDAKAAETYYLLFLSKSEQEKASNALDLKGIDNVAIATPAVVPALPAYSVSLILAVGLLFSIICGLSAAYVLEYLDPSFSTPHQMADSLGIPVIISFGKAS
jgi:uncharacterized protein involved in exopolysaccharide biosynthesis